MADFSSGVKRYVKAVAVVEVSFPVDFKDSMDVNCYQCKFFSRQSGICQLTKEISEYPQKYIGSHCPLEFINDNEEKEN